MSEYEYYLKTDLSRYKGNWIAIAGNKVVAFAASFREVAEKVDKNPEYKKALIARVPEKTAQLM